ncbi:1-phosphofructokinase family hexose kinase [Sinomonas sp. JGH33]|uniref:1-phosphofructokinase family hexose kinase n=1 Tax=Sinomonas terricola TaxID=3110330 RepID=A0ABU5TB53_9MICC|nr:1-phosphofructokinase family hexose kinase [Sinomonas sp. JGH33]MEA5456909.1 1-phosphofructokinase family hexose kinase [Sinomonas sp. JGH33]
MIVTVTPNPALDLTYHVDAWRAGASLRVEAPVCRAGGKGLNVARVLAQTGLLATAVTTVGGAAGAVLRRDLEESGLPHRLVPVHGATRTSVAVVDLAGGETTIMNERGSWLSHAERRALFDAATGSLSGAACLVGSGSLPPGVPAAFYADLVRSAHDAGVPAVIDAVGDGLLAAAEAGADLVKPNRAELEESTGCPDPAAGARRLISAGARIVLVSLGADGMMAVTRERGLVARFVRVLDGNPTGAGDAAVAAAASCLARGEDDPGVILRRATAWSAAAVPVPYAGELCADYRDFEHLVSLREGTRECP